MAPTFVFNSVSLSALNATNTYYVQMVSITPSPASTIISDLNTTVNNTPQVLTGVSYINNVFNFPDQTLNTRTYTVPHVGFVIAQQVGNTPNSSDPLIVYTPHTNSLGQEIIMPVGTYAILLDFSVGGLFAVVNAYQYSAGNYINTGAVYVDDGIIQLIGTKNNTVAYTNPITSGDINCITTGVASSAILASRSIQVTSEGAKFIFGFKNNADIKFTNGQLVYNGSATSNLFGINIFGSNFLQEGFTSFAIANASNWTLLTTGSIPNSSPIFSTSIPYRFLKLESIQNTVRFKNIDFYGCTVRTPNQNFV